jgi:hypothetical protein
MYEVIENQARFNRFTEADLVGEQPAHRRRRRRAFGHIELMWEQADAPPKKRSDAALADRAQARNIATNLGIHRVGGAFRTLESRIPNPESRQ